MPPCSPPDLLHHALHAQADRLPLTSTDRRLVGAFIDALDADGYLRRSLAQIAARAGLDADRDFTALNTALRLLQSLEPAGVGARNERECRMLRLRRCGRVRAASPADGLQ